MHNLLDTPPADRSTASAGDEALCQLTDAALVERLRSSDFDALGVLFDRYYPQIYRTAAGIACDVELESRVGQSQWSTTFSASQPPFRAKNRRTELLEGIYGQVSAIVQRMTGSAPAVPAELQPEARPPSGRGARRAEPRGGKAAGEAKPANRNARDDKGRATGASTPGVKPASGGAAAASPPAPGEKPADGETAASAQGTPPKPSEGTAEATPTPTGAARQPAAREVLIDRFRRQGDLALFEIGRVFAPESDTVRETRRLAVALTGRRQPVFWAGAERDALHDLADLKGVLETFLEHFGVRGVVCAPQPAGGPFFLESAALTLGGRAPLGVFGQLSPLLARQYDLAAPVYFSHDLAAALSEAGVPCQLHIVKGTAHGWSLPYEDETPQLMKQFFARYLKGEPEVEVPGVSSR